MAKARRLPSGNYRVRVMIDSKVESFTCATKREAEFAAAQAANASREASRHPERITVGEAADRFLAHRQNLLSPSTVIAYKRIRRLYMQSLVPLQVSLVRSEDLQEAVNAAAATLSPKTVRNVFTFFTAVIKSVRPDVSFKVILPQKRKTVYADAEDDDVAHLIAATQGKTIQTAIVIAAFTGMRRSEIAGLKREDIDTEGCVIHVRRALVLCDGGKWCEKSTKNTESERDIDVSAEEVRFILDRDSGKEYLLGITPDTITKSFIIHRDALGLKFRFHDLRSYNVSVMHALGMPDKYIVKRTGHATPNIMNRVYNRATQKRVRDASEVVRQKLDKLIPPSD